jgi:glycosyltransferase involved in cell wall biosynthesis
MKIVYQGVVLDGTGYSRFAVDTILAMDAAGIDVAVQPIKLATQTVQPPQRILELAQKDLSNPTHVIQHILPAYFSYKQGFKNIGFFHMETTHFKPSNWHHYCNLMDHLFVSCQENVQASKDSGVTKPLSIIPKPIDIQLYNRELYKQYDLGTNGRYVFYHIGDYSSKKNTTNLIKCYLESFSRDDNVVLVLKTYVEGVSSLDSAKLIADDINKIKHSLRKYSSNKYPPILLITEYLTDEAIMAIHAQGNCFITLERGAAWCIPAHDGVCMGNWAIASGWGGQNQFIENGKNGILLDYKMVSVEGQTRCPYPYLFTCHEQWSEPDYEQFKQAMQTAYKNRITKPTFGTTDVNAYSYATVGQQIKDILCTLQ